MWLKYDIGWLEVWARDQDDPDDPRLRLNFPPLKRLRRRLLTRCEWCNGRSRKGDLVNHALVSHRARERRWWRGETGLFHGDCSSIALARRVCICGPEGGPWEHEMDGYAHGLCATCGKYRGWIHADKRTPDYPGLHAERLMAQIPEGERDPATMAIVRDLWDHYRRARQ